MSPKGQRDCSSFQRAPDTALLETPAAQVKLILVVHPGFRGYEITSYIFCRVKVMGFICKTSHLSTYDVF